MLNISFKQVGMKKLIYVDNDNYNIARSDLERYVLPAIEFFGRIDQKVLQNSEIQIMHDFYKSQNGDEVYKILFDKNNVILSWSLYSPTSHYNSRTQFIHFLRLAGGSGIKDGNYVDVSGEIGKVIGYAILFGNIPYLYKVLSAIENNNIISASNGIFRRLRVCLDGKNPIRYEDVNLHQILGL